MSQYATLMSLTQRKQQIDRFAILLSSTAAPITIDEANQLAKHAAYIYSGIFNDMRSHAVPSYMTQNNATRMQSIITESPLAVVILKLYPSFLSNDLMPFGMQFARQALASIHESF